MCSSFQGKVLLEPLGLTGTAHKIMLGFKLTVCQILSGNIRQVNSTSFTSCEAHVKVL